MNTHLTTTQDSTVETQGDPTPAPPGEEAPFESALTEQQRLAWSLKVREIELAALYSDNENRVSQRNSILFGLFVVAGALLPLAVQSGVVHRQVALFFNVLAFFIMLAWDHNNQKMGEQNADILRIEQEAGYVGSQARRALRRQRKRTLPLPSLLAAQIGKQTLDLPPFLAARSGQQYWATVGLVLSADLLTLYQGGAGWNPLFLTALLCTIAIPFVIRHKRA